MQRYTYKDPLTGKSHIYYHVGRGCHMRALSHNNAIRPMLVLKRKPR